MLSALLLSLALPLCALESSAPSLPSLPKPTSLQFTAVRQAAMRQAPELQGLDFWAPDFALAVAPLAEQVAQDGDLASAKRRAAIAVAKLSLDAAEAIRAGQGSDEQLRALALTSSRWDWYGEPAVTALARLRDELRQRRIQPLLRDPFASRKQANTTAAAPTAGSGAPRLAPASQSPAPSSPPPAPKPPKKSDLGIRAATASLFVPAIVALVHVGGLAFLAMTLAVCAFSLSEFAGLMKKGGRAVSKPAVLLAGLGLSAVLVAGLPVAPALAAVAGLAAASELWAKTPSIERAAATVLGAALFGLLPAHLALLRALAPHGAALTLATFGAAWCSDTAAYFFGKRFGRRKIAPTISPNKTWEGAIAGFAFAVLLPVGLSLVRPAWLPLSAALKVGMVMGSIGQLGGYVNSMIKRANGAKDSGRLFPGHGGAIDRFDPFLLSAAVLYYLLRP